MCVCMSVYIYTCVYREKESPKLILFSFHSASILYFVSHNFIILTFNTLGL